MTFFGATLLTAIATVVLAVFAIVTAWYARRAFLKQSQEVAAIEQQVQLQREQSGREQTDRRRAQASLVYMSIEPRPHVGNLQDMRDAVCVYNTSKQPVYEITLMLGNQADQRRPMLLPGETQVWDGLGTAYATGRRPLYIAFRDSAGIRWLRRPDRDLTEGG